VASKRPECGGVECLFTSGRSLRVSNFLGEHIRLGDEIQFSMPEGGTPTSPELLIKRRAGPFLYQTLIGYAAKPKSDRCQHTFVSAEICNGRLGFNSLHLTCTSIRDYFYSLNRNHSANNQRTFYDLLKTRPNASLGELRLAHKLRELELLAAGASASQRAVLARAFNVLSVPELRACYDALLNDPKSPTLFPFAGFGIILVLGSPLNDRFFVRQVISFIPERRKRRFKLPLWKMTYYSDRAVYRDGRARIEVTLDPILLPIGFDPNWNRWKHLLGIAIEVEAQFTRTGKYIRKGNQWKLVTWEMALASRIKITLPENLEEALSEAKRAYQRFGQYSSWIEEMCRQIEREPMEKSTLERLCAAEGIPADFDVSRINWKPDYDPYYYKQLLKRAKRLYLFRTEYVIETANAIIVETPQTGHATYFFSPSKDLKQFLCAYARTTKEAIRRNQENCAEHLGYLGRVVHRRNRNQWLAEVKKWLGEPVNYGEDSGRIHQ